MATQTEIDENIKIIIDNILAAYKELTLKDFFDCIVKLMECAEVIPTLVGTDKKKVVKSVLVQIIQRINIPNKGEKDLILLLVNSGLVDLIIDGIVKLTKEGCKINIQDLASKCCCKSGKCVMM